MLEYNGASKGQMKEYLSKKNLPFRLEPPLCSIPRSWVKKGGGREGVLVVVPGELQLWGPKYRDTASEVQKSGMLPVLCG